MEQYLQQREEFIESVTKSKYKDIEFTQVEEQANNLFRQILIEERSQKDDSFFKGYTLRHQETLKNESRIYKALKKLPKGGILHVHNDCCVDADWFMKEIAYNQMTYFNDEQHKFKSFNAQYDIEDGYKNLYQERELSSNKEEFDIYLRNQLFILEEERLNSEEDIWSIFERKILSLDTLTYNKSVFKKYLKQYLTNFIEDGVDYLEIRTELGVKKNDDGTYVTLDEEISIIKQVVQELQELNPIFSLKIIFECLKYLDLAEIEQRLRLALSAKKQYPDLICGFDMIQQEDTNKSTLEMCEVFVKMNELQKEYGVELPFLFHGGESLQTITNTNLFDIILLGSKRIGHGINLVQHSYLMDIIKEKEICLEICPVSNQVLKYIDDIRLHPIKTILNYGIKVCINPDDPGVFNYKGVTMDYFYASLGTELDYKDLKLCVYNSIKYSLLEEEKKIILWNVLQNKFEQWSIEFLEDYKN